MKRFLFVPAAAALVCCLLASSPVLAARPLATDDAGTVAGQHFEAEFGYILDQPRGGAEKSSGLTASLKYGLLENLDLGAELPYELSPVSGLGDICLKCKYRFLEESDSLPALAVRADIKTATGDANKGLGSGQMDYGAHALVSKTWDLVSVSADIGYTLVGVPAGEQSANALFYGLSLTYAALEQIDLMAELTGASVSGGGESPLQAQLGANYALLEDLKIDGGVTLGLNDATSKYLATAGLTYGF